MAKYYDLCSTCRHGKDCTYKATADRAIYYCEEFQIIPAEPAQPTVSCEQDDTNKVCYDNTLMGLCVNCENNKTCKNATIEGGIWHCEEYR